MITENDLNKVKDIIYLDEVEQSMIDGFRNGYKGGVTTHFQTIDNVFKWLSKNVILFAGVGNYGKSKMVRQLTLLRALRNKEKTAIFSPEDLPADYFYNDLIHSLVGKSPYKGHKNQMTEKEYKEAMHFIKDYFFLLYPENDAPTPQYINERFREAIEAHGIKFCITDPFNQLDNDWEISGRDDRYVSDFLTQEKRFAVKHDVCKITVAHVNSRVKLSDGGDFETPNVYNLAGGAMWNNKCDDIIFVHRPYRISDPDNPTTIFSSAKIKKQILCGRPGNVELSFDILTNRYSEYTNAGLLGPFDGEAESIFDSLEPKEPIF